MFVRNTVVAAAIAGFVFGAGWHGTARAEGESPPLVGGSLSVEIENDNTYKSDDPDAEVNDLYTTTEPEIVFQFLPELSLTLHGVLEPVRDPGPGDDRVFDDHGLYLETVLLAYGTDRFSVYGGKFTPNFGKAWDQTPGVYGDDFNGDYEIAEQVGLGGSVSFGNESAGTHTIEASVFFADTTILSDSVITRRGRTKHDDGGVGNTEDLSNFAVSLDGEEIAALPGVSYHVAYLHRGKGVNSASDENGFVGGIIVEREIRPVIVTVLAEYAHFIDAQGVSGQDRDYLTGGVRLGWNNWNVAMTAANRDTDGGTSDTAFQVSGGYEFEIGLSVDVAWKTVEEADVDSQTVGVLVAYGFAF